MKRIYPTSLSQADALERLNELFAFFAPKFREHRPRLEVTQEHRAVLCFHALGLWVEVTIRLEPRQVIVEVAPPVRLLPFLPLALRKMDHELPRWFAS